MPKEKAKVTQNDIMIKRINTSRFSTQSLGSQVQKYGTTCHQI